MEQLAQWDKELFVWLNGLGVEGYDSFWLFITHIENWIPLYILFFIFFLLALSRKQTLITTLFAGLTILSALGITTFVKNTVSRLRPNNTPELIDTIRILQNPIDYSFWSGHAAVSFATSIFVIWVLRSRSKWAYLIFIWPLLFTLSRVYVGVHYPIDLFVGAIVGWGIGYFYYSVWKKIINPIMT